MNNIFEFLKSFHYFLEENIFTYLSLLIDPLTFKTGIYGVWGISALFISLLLFRTIIYRFKASQLDTTFYLMVGIFLHWFSEGVLRFYFYSRIYWETILDKDIEWMATSGIIFIVSLITFIAAFIHIYGLTQDRFKYKVLIGWLLMIPFIFWIFMF